MKVKTSELIGPALDWVVCEIAGMFRAYPKIAGGKKFRALHAGNSAKYIHPSTDWSQGGPIIEQEEIELHVLASGLDIAAHPTFKPGDVWEANLWPADVDIVQICGPTPLIAAMRCFVASTLGDEVDVPDELS